MTEADQVAALLARAPVKFTPVETFISDEFRSDYIKGLTYTLHNTGQQFNPGYGRRMERLDVKLATCMVRWLAAGKITLDLSGIAPAAARVSGAGVISDPLPP